MGEMRTRGGFFRASSGPTLCPVRAPLIAVLWLGFYFTLARYGVYLLPSSIARQTTLPMYLAGVQLVSIALGISIVTLASRTRPSVRQILLPFPWHSASPSTITRLSLWALLLAPLTYLCAHALGMYFAYDTLIYELATRGARAVQQQTGELGRSAAQDTLWTIVPFTLVLAPLGEELLFRGGVYGAVQVAFDRFRQAPMEEEKARDESPDSLQIAGLRRKKKTGASLSERLSGWIVRGGGAALVSGAVFGALHADTSGGLGIVRVVSATTLGMACGLARMTSGGLATSIALHVGYNFIALGTMRGWLVTMDYPTKYGIPTILGPMSIVLLVVVLVHAFVLGRARS